MPKGRKRLEDSKAACNFIKSIRISNRNLIKKLITSDFQIDNMKFKSRVIVVYNKLTGTVSTSSKGIRYKLVDIYPSVNQELKCINKHAIEDLNKRRIRALEYSRRKRL